MRACPTSREGNCCHTTVRLPLRAFTTTILLCTHSGLSSLTQRPRHQGLLPPPPPDHTTPHPRCPGPLPPFLSSSLPLCLFLACCPPSLPIPSRSLPSPPCPYDQPELHVPVSVNPPPCPDLAHESRISSSLPAPPPLLHLCKQPRRCKFSPSQFAQDNSLTLVGLQSFKVSAGSD
jgi:hypothetical protein